MSKMGGSGHPVNEARKSQVIITGVPVCTGTLNRNKCTRLLTLSN